MIDITDKNILASISRLRGASLDEIAANTGVATEVVMPKLARLISMGLVRRIDGSNIHEQADRQSLTADEPGIIIFEMTSRGLLRLRTS